MVSKKIKIKKLASIRPIGNKYVIDFTQGEVSVIVTVKGGGILVTLPFRATHQ